MLFLILLILELISLYILARKVTRKIFRLVRSPYLFAILFFPGTFIHEMSHFLSALILLVPTGKVDLFPRIDDHEVKLGSVAIAKTDPIRRTLIGISPLIFGASIIASTVFYVYTNNLLNNAVILVILGYLVFEIGNTMFSSKKDMEGVIPTFVAISLIGLVLYYLGLRINLNLNLEIVQKIDIFILVPIVIDFVIYSV